MNVTVIPDGSRKRPRAEETLMEEHEMDVISKLAAAKVSPSVVSVVSRHVPEEMAVFRWGPGQPLTTHRVDPAEKEIVYLASGIIIECDCEGDVVSRNYFSIVITAANIFVRTIGVQPHKVKVDVYFWNGKLCHGQLLACDFHYNLAALRIRTDSPMETASLRGLDDVLSIYPSEQLGLQPETSFLLRPHSELFKVFPQTKITCLWRAFRPPNALVVSSGVFRTNSSDTRLDCNELYWAKDIGIKDASGGPLINSSGEVIGVMFYKSPFLPINIVSRQYRRPWVGVAVANLHSSRLDFLERFMKRFPKITTGVVVTKVTEGSPAYCSGLRPKDVIVKSDGKLVRSKLEFFDVLWEKVGKSVKVSALRPIDGEKLKVSLTVGEPTPDNFYKWRQPDWTVVDVD